MQMIQATFKQTVPFTIPLKAKHTFEQRCNVTLSGKRRILLSKMLRRKCCSFDLFQCLSNFHRRKKNSKRPKSFWSTLWRLNVERTNCSKS